MIVGFKDKKVSLGMAAAHFLVDIFFLPFIACVFIMEDTKVVIYDELMFHSHQFPVVRNYLNVFFYFKLSLFVLDAYRNLKEKYNKLAEIESVIHECKKP